MFMVIFIEQTRMEKNLTILISYLTSWKFWVSWKDLNLLQANFEWFLFLVSSVLNDVGSLWRTAQLLVTCWLVVCWDQLFERDSSVCLLSPVQVVMTEVRTWAEPGQPSCWCSATLLRSERERLNKVLLGTLLARLFLGTQPARLALDTQHGNVRNSGHWTPTWTPTWTP